MFGQGSDFARKITYRSEGSVEDHIKFFRTDPQLRIAVSVDQLGTGTNVKPVECLVFMRKVGSRTLFNQMRGRGVRTMDATDFWTVTPGAQQKGQVKDRCVLIDAVGLTDDDVVLNDARPIDRKPSASFESLLRDIGLGITDDEVVSSVAARLVRLHNKLSDDEREEFASVAGGSTMHDLANDLRSPQTPSTS